MSVDWSKPIQFRHNNYALNLRVIGRIKGPCPVLVAYRSSIDAADTESIHRVAESGQIYSNIDSDNDIINVPEEKQETNKFFKLKCGATIEIVCSNRYGVTVMVTDRRNFAKGIHTAVSKPQDVIKDRGNWNYNQIELYCEWDAIPGIQEALKEILKEREKCK
jgi:hypothetical protein